jgi:hypothetical protein
MNLQYKNVLFFYELFEKMFENPEQEIKAATVRAISKILNQIDDIDKMQ